MNKIITAGCMAVATFAAVAVPTKKELERAKPVVENMTKADLAAYKAGEKTAQKVAAAHIDYARKAEGEAAKYLLLQGAFKLYARCGEYNLAADTIVAMNRNIKDLPPTVIAEIVGDELRYVSDDKAPRLVAMLKEAKTQIARKKIATSPTGVARSRPRGSLRGRRKDMEDTTHLQATIDGYTWSYRVNNGEATIEAKKDGKFACAVTPNPTGDVMIPSMLNGVKVTGIGQEAFCHYCGPKSVKIPEGVKSIGWCAFYRCTNLTAVTLPKSLKDIGHGAFAHCCGLTFVTIPEGVTNIAAEAFRFCEELRSINLPSGVRHLNDCVFDACIHLDTITIPEELESIGSQVFYNCWGLKSVTIPSKVRRIGKVAFMQCHGLTSLTIGSGVQEISEEAFKGCGNLTAVTMLGERPNASKEIFKGCDKLTKIHVPANAKSWVGMKEWQGKKLVFDAKEK